MQEREQEGEGGQGSPALLWSREWPDPSLGGRRGTLKFTSLFMLSVGVVAFSRHPVPIPCHLFPVPVLFQVKFSKHGAVLWSHPTPGPVIRDPWVCKPFSHDSPVAWIKKKHRENIRWYCPNRTCEANQAKGYMTSLKQLYLWKPFSSSDWSRCYPVTWTLVGFLCWCWWRCWMEPDGETSPSSGCRGRCCLGPG